MKTVILGFDAFDPVVFEQLAGSGQLPHLEAHARAGGYSRFAVANPPQSEVSWTSIATGLNPGGHGMFDFVHRDPTTYRLRLSLLATRSGVLGPRFVPPHQARTIFDQAADAGFPSTALWWPAMFPARAHSPVRSTPGLGTPDVHGRMGVGTLFTTDSDLAGVPRKTHVAVLQRQGKGQYRGVIAGPARHTRKSPQATPLALELEVLDEAGARITVGDRRVELWLGAWSPILELSFKIGPFLSLRAITRMILTQTRPELRCYMLPLQLHPLHPIWPYATPRGFVRQLWREAGPFLTLGWPQDTTALEEGHISDEQFLALCDDIFATRAAILLRQVALFKEGLLASVFDSLDRVQHMFWRRRPDAVHACYRRLDWLCGRVGQALAAQKGPPAQLIVVSDHGFSDFRYKAHLNRWLIDHGHLTPDEERPAGGLRQVRWDQSRAYALGLNSIYLNLAGREGAGYVAPAAYGQLQRQLRDELLRWRGLDGRPVVRRVLTQAEAFEGPLASAGPDLVVGFAPGYRASAETGLGEWGPASLEPNRDHWEADHCIDPEAVPGVIMASSGLRDLPRPSYRDIPALALGGLAASGPAPGRRLPDDGSSDEDEERVEQRLKDLGYL